MRILIVTVHYPPIASAWSRAMAELSGALANAEHRVEVLTIEPIPGHPEFNTKFSETRRIPKKVNIHRVPMGPINRLIARVSGYNHVRHVNEREIQAIDTPLPAPRHPGSSWFRRKIESSHTSADWFPAALLEASRMVRHSSYDLVVSFAGPTTCHLLAYLATGRRSVRRVMIYGENYNSANLQAAKWGLTGRLRRTVEVAALRTADRVIVGAETFVPYLEKWGVDRSKIRVTEFPKIDVNLVIEPGESAGSYGREIVPVSAATVRPS